MAARDEEGESQVHHRELRIGIIGTSWWADFAFLPALTQQPRAALVAICGRDRARADLMAQKFKIPQVFTDYREMFEKGGLDAVVVATPDDQHYAMVMDALNAGLHVLCDKPIALNVPHAREMVEKAEASGLKHMVFFTGSWMPHARYLKRLVDDGFVGKVYHCNIRYVGGYARSGQYQWRFDANRANGILGDLGSHMIQSARLLVGEISAVSASLSTQVGGAAFENPGNDHALLIVEFANGARGAIEVSAVGHIGKRDMVLGTEIYGAEGTLEVTMELAHGGHIRGLRQNEADIRDLPVPAEYWNGDDSKNAEKSDHFRTAIAHGTRLFVDAILDDTPLSPNLRDGLRVQQVIAAAIESDKTGRRVVVEY